MKPPFFKPTDQVAARLLMGGLFALAFIAFFRRFSEFGFYSDDPAQFGQAINRPWREVVDYFVFCLTKWPQGRPLGVGVNLNLFPSVVFSLGGLSGLYLAAFGIVAGNIALLFRLVAKFQPPLVAFAAAGFYALAPASTVNLSLVYAYNFEIAVLCAILSAHFAISGRRVWFAIFHCAALLMVEPVAMFALLVPLFLCFRRNRTWLREAILLIAIWVGCIFAVLLARRVIGDPWGSERTSEIAANPLAVFHNGMTSAFIGFRTHFDLVLERLIQPFKEGDPEVYWVMLAGAAITTLTAWITRSYLVRGRSSLSFGDGGTEATGREWWPGVRLLLAGCAVMLAVYFCYFRTPWYPANWRTCFLSGVHTIAALGSCLVFAAFVSLLMQVLPRRFRAAAVVLPILAFTCLAGFGEIVQRDFATSWKFQRTFWQAYGRLCPDATDGTFVLVLDRNLPKVRYIDLFSWGSEILPGALFSYQNLPITGPTSPGASAPVFLTHPPSVILTAPELVTAIKSTGLGYAWKPTYYFMLPKSAAQQPQAGNVIVLTCDPQGTWHRLEGAMAVDEGVLLLRPTGGENLLRKAVKSPLAAVYGL